jgi:lysozyme
MANEGGTMNITPDGLALIKNFEGFRAHAYKDAVGIWTIGFGHTSRAGEPHVLAGLTISRDEADAILERDVNTFAEGVRHSLRVPLTDEQFSALVSFAYNVGVGAFANSSVLAAVNRQDFSAVPRRLALWNKAGGRVLPGLVRRRAAEAELFARGTPQATAHPVDAPQGKPLTQSKTIWSAAAALTLALLQVWAAPQTHILATALVLGIAVAVGIIIFERMKKLKEEAL